MQYKNQNILNFEKYANMHVKSALYLYLYPHLNECTMDIRTLRRKRCDIFYSI